MKQMFVKQALNNALYCVQDRQTLDEWWGR